MTTTREQAREDTRERIVAAARTLLLREGGVTLRAVARELGMTAPALYRYAASHEDLVRLVAIDIDDDVARRLERAAAGFPADDPLARMIAGAIEFRGWALSERKEFALVFTNLDVACLNELEGEHSTGMFFSGLLAQVWAKYQFPFPSLEELDPDLVEILRDPLVPADLSEFPDEMRPLIWLLQRAWSRLYGTVTLEVFEHIDPRIVEQGHLFRAMIEDQAEGFGLTGELDRIRELFPVLRHSRQPR